MALTTNSGLSQVGNTTPQTTPSGGPQKTMTGGRAVISVNNVAVGVFDSVSYSANIGSEPIFILGKFNPAEIAVTSQEAISLTCSGFRIVGNGPYADSAVATVGQLLALEGITITILDRQTNATILKVGGVIATGYSGSYNAKATSKITVTYVGTTISDESSISQDGYDDTLQNAPVLGS